MPSQSENDNGIPTGQIRPTSMRGQFNNISFLVQQALMKMQTNTVVRVVSCTNTGGLSPVGFVDVVPMVNQIDGDGKATPHTTIYNMPYIRVQGGKNGIIIDPEVGDIGMCAFASRDISKVKSTKKKGNPGSFRTFSFSDGMYLGGILNAEPEQYIQFNTSGIKVFSPTKITVEAPDVLVEATTVQVNAATSATVTSPIINLGALGQTLKAFLTIAFQVLYNGHTHAGGAVPDQQSTASEITTTVKGG